MIITRDTNEYSRDNVLLWFGKARPKWNERWGQWDSTRYCPGVISVITCRRLFGFTPKPGSWTAMPNYVELFDCKRSTKAPVGL